MISLNNRLTFQNIVSRPVQTILLLLSIGILSFILFGGFVIDQSLQSGMDNMERRLGADLMVVPAESEEMAEDILIEGSRGYFYFDRSIYEEISTIEGIEKATPQFYLKSLSADCCSSEVEIVFFDPDTDFLIQPWINESFGKKLGTNKAVVGSSIHPENNKIKLFGKEYDVAAKLAKTGTAMDNSVYFVFDSIQQIVSDAEIKGVYILDSQKQTDVISTVFIDIEDGYATKDILKSIHVKLKKDIGIVYPKEMAQSLSLKLKNIYEIIRLVLITVLLLSLVIMLIVYLASVNERKREISLFRILGASKIKLVLLLIKESTVLSFVGSIIGCAFAALIVIPFGNYIGKQLSMPYLGPDVLQSFSIMLMVSVLVAVIGIAASFCPTLHICCMEPYDALRKEGE